jgi:hypothetical protein
MSPLSNIKGSLTYALRDFGVCMAATAAASAAASVLAFVVLAIGTLKDCIIYATLGDSFEINQCAPIHVVRHACFIVALCV